MCNFISQFVFITNVSTHLNKRENAKTNRFQCRFGIEFNHQSGNAGEAAQRRDDASYRWDIQI